MIESQTTRLRVTYYNGYYYGSYTGAIDHSETLAAGPQRLILFRSPNLEDLFTSTDQHVVIVTGADGWFWAPYPLFMNGRMYIYYTNPEDTKASNCGGSAAGPCKDLRRGQQHGRSIWCLYDVDEPTTQL